MTRHERHQLLAVLISLRLGRVNRATEALRKMISAAEAEHDTEDTVNAALERLSKGTGNDQRPI